MKVAVQIIIFLFSIVQVAFCQVLENEDLFHVVDTIEIKGKIFGYNSERGDHFITFSTHDLFGKKTKKAFQIASDGTFEVKVNQAFDGDIQMNYKDAFIDLYAIVGKSLTVEIYDDKVDKSDFGNAFVVKGELADVNNLMIKFASEMLAQDFPPADFDKDQTDSVFASKNMLLLKSKQKLLELFIAKNNIKDRIFIDWQTNQLNYTMGKDILIFPFFGRENRAISHRQLLKLINPIGFNNQSALHNSSYYIFLNTLSQAHQIIFNINPLYEKTRIENNMVAEMLDLIDSYASSITRQLLYYNAFHLIPSQTSTSNKFLPRFEKTLTQPYLARALRLDAVDGDTDFKPYDILEKLKGLKVDVVLKKRLIDLFSSYRGTSLYIDFWGDWCPPCLEELPKYPDIITTMKGQPIKFLFLSTFTTDESMKAIKEKFGIEADFINLNKDEVSIVNNAFGFHSYPSHFFVDREGRVLKKMFRIGKESIPAVAKVLQGLNAPKN